VITNNIVSVDEDERAMISPAKYFSCAAVVGTGVVTGDWSEQPAISTPEIKIRLIRIPYQ
jgi:hypothetical protein